MYMCIQYIQSSKFVHLSLEKVWRIPEILKILWSEQYNPPPPPHPSIEKKMKNLQVLKHHHF